MSSFALIPLLILGIWLAPSSPRSNSRSGQFGSNGVALGSLLRLSRCNKTNFRLAIRSAIGPNGGLCGADAAGSMDWFVCWLKGDERSLERPFRCFSAKLSKDFSIITPISIPPNSLRVSGLFRPLLCLSSLPLRSSFRSLRAYLSRNVRSLLTFHLVHCLRFPHRFEFRSLDLFSTLRSRTRRWFSRQIAALSV